MLSGLKLIVTYNRIFGNTFFGWTDNDESKHKWKPILLKLWNVCLLVILSLPILFVGFGFIDPNRENITSQESPTKFDLPNLLFVVTGINFIGQTIVIGLYLILIGPKLISVLAEKKINFLDQRSEYKTGKTIIIFQVCLVMLPMIGNLVSVFTFQTISPFLLFMAIMTFPSITIATTVLVLIAYQSYTVRHEFDEIISRKVCLVVIYKMLCNIERSICKMDQYVSIYILFSLFSNTLFTVSAICSFALNSQTKIIESMITLFFGLSNLSIPCYLCKIIPASLTNMINKVQQDLDFRNNGYDSENRQILIQIREINTRIGFTAFGFFRVNGNTFLTCLAQIISYSVIIIQTASQDVTCSTAIIQNCTCSCFQNNSC